MTSTRQVTANRANARKSTGPKTPAGKAVAARNATQHGILAAGLFATKSEDAGTLEAVRDATLAELAPVGPLEEALAGRVVSCLWRLRRVQAAEVGLFDFDRAPGFGFDYMPGLEDSSERSETADAARGVNGNRDALGLLTRYETALERSLYGALHELQRLQAACRSGADAPPPAVVDVEVRGLPEGAG